jgi:transposase
LSDNVVDLKKLIISYDSENRLLKEEINLLRYKLFGRKSEKLSRDVGSGQLLLFNEAEQAAEAQTEPQEEISVPAHKRRRGKRTPLPKDLPRVEVVHDLSEEDKQCACGATKSQIGQVESEQLDIVPPQCKVIKNIRLKYVCKCCEGTEADEPAVSIAPMPEQLLPKSIATPGLMAYIITSKYADSLPLYRQEKIFERLGVELKRQTMASWVIKVAQKCRLMVDMMCREIRSGPLIQIDETGVQVLEEPGREATTKSYMWVFRGGDPAKPVLVYQYHPTRSGDVAKEFLADYTGYVQTDGYVGYEFIDDLPDVKHLGCWAHVRRKFIEAVKARGKSRKTKKKSSAEVALDYITKLYAIEQSAKACSLGTDQLYALRRKKAEPLLEKFRTWLDETALITPPGGLLGTAISYTLNQWDRLLVYLNDGRLHPDNNLTENAIRPFVVGRKNWLFSATPDGAHASAALYSLIETAKANGLEPYWYLRYLLERLPAAKTQQDHRALLPQYVDKKQIGRTA